MFKRFRDSISGLFVTKAEAAKRPETTQAENPNPPVTGEARRILLSARGRAAEQRNAFDRYTVLAQAIERVLKL